MKICKKCNEEKELNEYFKRKDSKDGLFPHCKKCNTENYRQWKLNNKEYYNEYHKQYRENNKKPKENNKEYHKQYRENNKEYYKQYRESNKEYYKEYSKRYRENNKEKNNLYYKQRRQNDPLYKLSCTIRCLLSSSFKRKGYWKKSKTEQILGCTINEFIIHIQSQFTEGMTLENHGEWEIDHKIPISSAGSEEEIIKLNHYTNLQPLWKEDNRSKLNKIPLLLTKS